MSEPRYIDVGLESFGLLKVPQAAGRLAVSERTVRRLIASGELKSVRIGNAIHIVPEDLTAFVENGMEATRRTRARE
jgi:excisionase family DNA binding protein